LPTLRDVAEVLAERNRAKEEAEYWDGFWSVPLQKASLEDRKSPTKREPPPTLEEIPAALAASQRARAASDAIRAKAGRPPLPESTSSAAWRRRLESVAENAMAVAAQSPDPDGDDDRAASLAKRLAALRKVVEG
jgi:hypothetical protein